MLALAGALLAGWSAPAPAASSLAEKRAEARQVEAQINDFEARLERRIEAYNHVHQQYTTTLARLRRTRQLLAITRNNLRHAQRQLAEALIRSYKGGDPDVIGYLLSARSISELVDQVQAISTTTQTQSNLVSTISRLRREMTRREAELHRQKDVLARQVAAQARAKQRVEQGLASRRRMLDGINTEIRHIIAARERAAAARAAAAAAAAQRAAAAASMPAQGAIPVPASSSVGAQAAAIAQQYLGVPYQWGGSSPSGFDCSGLVAYVYGQVGISLPHYAAAQYSAGPHVPRDALEPGDLVFFDGLGHVGIYIGGNAFVHAPHTGDVVKISSISGWYAETYVGATRVG